MKTLMECATMTYGHVVAHKVPIALVSVKLDGKATRVTQGLWGSRLMHNSGESGVQWGPAPNL